MNKVLIIILHSTYLTCLATSPKTSGIKARPAAIPICPKVRAVVEKIGCKNGT